MMHYTQTKNIHIHHTHINTQENQKKITLKNKTKSKQRKITKRQHLHFGQKIGGASERDREADTHIYNKSKGEAIYHPSQV
jgi:hypothetical protein